MNGTRIVFKITDVDAPQHERTRSIGPSDAPWSVFVLNGHARRFETRGEGSFSIKWMAEGRARYAVDRRSRTVSREAVILVDQSQPYEMEFERRSGAQSFCLFFAAPLVREAWASQEAGFAPASETGALRPFPNLLFRPSNRLASVLRGLAEDGPEADAAMLESRLMTALSEAVASAHRHRGMAGRVPAARPATRAHLLASLERARQSIDDDSGVGCDLASLAQDAGVSKFHLLRLFKAVYGATPMAYAERLRMQTAQTRLRSGAKPVGEVAAELGYDSPSAFARAFRRWTGAAPTNWRT